MPPSGAGLQPALFILVNGVEATPLSPLDRGLHYGDGVFRTLRLDQGRPLWWQDHLAKLAADAGRLGLPCPAPEVWHADLAQLGGRLEGGILKLILTRGVGARGYRPPQECQATRILIHDPAPPLAANWPGDGLRARVCTLRLAEQPALAGIKHLNRLENVLARAEWNDPKIHEGLLLDAADRVVCGTMSNLFFWRDGRLHTPRLDRCGIAGVVRGRLLARYPAQQGDYALEEILAADEVMLSNSVLGLVRLARLEDRYWPKPVISPLLKEKLHGPA